MIPSNERLQERPRRPRAFRHRRGLRSLLRNQNGSSAVELGLIAPVFLLVLFAIFDIGRIVLVMGTMEFAAQEGASFASLHGSSSPKPVTADEIAARVRSFVQGVDADAISVTVSWSPDASSGSTVAVNTSYEHKALLGLLPIPPLTLSGRASLVVM